MWTLLLLDLACVPVCDNHLDCAGDDLCWDGTCIHAVDREWEIDIVASEVDQVAPDGAPWDSNHSPPDLYASFGVDKGDGCVTSFVPDSFDPVWYEACDMWIPWDPLFYVDLWDVDDPVDEFATTFEWDGQWPWLDVARTAGHEMTYMDPTGTAMLWMSVWPLPESRW